MAIHEWNLCEWAMVYGVELYLRGTGSSISLERFRFLSSEPGGVRAAVRGRSPGAYLNAHTFVWSAGVRAMVVALLRAKLHGLGRQRHYRGEGVMSVVDSRPSEALVDLSGGVHLAGGRGSLASALDYAISARTTWVRDLFGEERGGGLLAATIFRRYNSNLKRAGPVLITVDAAVVAPHMIHPFFEERIAGEAVIRDAVEALEK